MGSAMFVGRFEFGVHTLNTTQHMLLSAFNSEMRASHRGRVHTGTRRAQNPRRFQIEARDEAR
jgi:hypothetical protein